MKILFITNRNPINHIEALSWFKLYCENYSDLCLFTDFDQAKTFIIEKLIKAQKHIDLIVTDWKINNDNAKSILSWLRNSGEVYSDYNFQLSSIPILLIEDLERQSSDISEGFNGVISGFPNEPLRYGRLIKKAIRNWRSSISEDLDLIGLDPKSQKVYQNHRSNFISYFRLKILSRQFVDSKSKRLNYIWTNSDLKLLNDSNQAFYDKMAWTRRTKPKYLEKEFHNFFLANPTFIKNEDYIHTKEHMLYEKHLYKNGTKFYDEPDFLNKPFEYALNYPEVFEIKRNTQRILRYKKDNFLSNAKKSFLQVKRYKQYLTSEDTQHQFYIKKYFGEIFNKYEYTLLMGSLEEVKEQEDLIEKLKEDFDFKDINLITYEELLDKHIRLCNRLSEFDPFSL